VDVLEAQAKTIDGQKLRVRSRLCIWASFTFVCSREFVLSLRNSVWNSRKNITPNLSAAGLLSSGYCVILTLIVCFSQYMWQILLASSDSKCTEEMSVYLTQMVNLIDILKPTWGLIHVSYSLMRKLMMCTQAVGFRMMIENESTARERQQHALQSTISDRKLELDRYVV
jgi:hypothetical protein